MPDQALSDVKVVDFTHYVAGPYCTKLLADYGADVVKVERPDGGDRARRMGPFPEDIPHPEKSGLFLHLNTNKRGITLDLNTQAAVNIVKELVKEADLVVESFQPGTMAHFGLDYDSLKEINPQLVMTSISNFGQTGPYKDFRSAEIMVYGMGGAMYTTGLADREPIKLGVNVHLYQGGATAAVATMGALIGSRRQRTGQQVDVSLMETQVGSVDRRLTQLVAYQYTGDVRGRSPLRTAGYPNGVYPCADGYLQVLGNQAVFSQELCGCWESRISLKDPKWYEPDAQGGPRAPGGIRGAVSHLDPGTGEGLDAWHTAQESRVLSGPLNTMEELAQDPEFLSRGVFAQIDHPEAGRLDYPGRPFIMNESPWAVNRPAPLLGQHNQEILGSLGYSGDDIVRLRDARGNLTRLI